MLLDPLHPSLERSLCKSRVGKRRFKRRESEEAPHMLHRQAGVQPRDGASVAQPLVRPLGTDVGPQQAVERIGAQRLADRLLRIGPLAPKTRT